MRIPGKCHCGNISFTFTWEPDPVEIPARACDCTFCTKHGGLWTSNPRGTLEIDIADPKHVTRYSHGTETAEFLVCSRCGVVPAVTSRIDGRLYAVVSVNAFEGVDPAMIRRAPISFAEEETGTRLARRQRSWIPDVEVIEASW